VRVPSKTLGKEAGHLWSPMQGVDAKWFGSGRVHWASDGVGGYRDSANQKPSLGIRTEAKGQWSMLRSQTRRREIYAAR